MSIVKVIVMLYAVFLVVDGSQSVVGFNNTSNSISCSNEGMQVAAPAGVIRSVCTVCYCREGEISCYDKKCPSLEGCHQVVYPKPAGVCCSPCKGCTYKGRDYVNDEEWTDPDDPCRTYTCLAGVVTSSVKKCYAKCKNPVSSPGTCCPVCSGCESDDGFTYRDGDYFPASRDKCVTCRCTNGTRECGKIGCPVLNCQRQFWKLSAGDCCPHCTGSRSVFKLTGFCLYQTHVYRSGLSFKPDRCTTCECRAGTIVCRVDTCPILDCPDEEILPSTGACCRKCREKKTCSASDGNTYAHGVKWLKSVCNNCECNNGAIECTRQSCDNNLDCPKNFRLQNVRGECCPVCVEMDATCTVFGDPHYKTYDGKLYDFQGKCRYTLTKLCEDDSFHVIVSNRIRSSNLYSWTKNALVKINGSQILLDQMLKVKVDGRRIALPFVNKRLFDIRRDGQAVVVTTKIGIKIIWDGDSYLEVSVPALLKKKLCGLCGNYNGIEADDLTGSDGQIYFAEEDFGDTWLVGKDRNCRGPKRNVIRVINPNQRLLAHQECAALYGNSFARCRQKIDVRAYYKACVMDVTDCPENQQCSCEAMVAYSRLCEKELNTFLNWRTPYLCGAPKCQIGAVYDTCVSACPETCANHGAKRRKCKRPCIGGCRCLPGLVLHKNRCIPIDECSSPKTKKKPANGRHKKRRHSNKRRKSNNKNKARNNKRELMNDSPLDNNSSFK
ncbi:BMP-binding endothelial regulator protein-like [Tubulanus polymorphus]|uniref:BMP-binding endothelial regulator protein-like n=1 Tax=Tubulanus polymorphus TaxID=672921 RepID=UPI003DA1E782